MDFFELGIPLGSVLVYRDGAAQAIVQSAKSVVFDGGECSLTMATRRVKGLADDYPIQPAPFWTFNGKTVKELYEDYYAALDES